MPPEWLDPRPYFADLPAPRRETRNQLHKLHDILMMVLCAVLSGVEDWVGMADFAEDACRTRKNHSAENLALMRRLALNLLTHKGLPRDSIRRRKRRAVLNDEYRLRLLFGTPTPVTT